MQRYSHLGFTFRGRGGAWGYTCNTPVCKDTAMKGVLLGDLGGTWGLGRGTGRDAGARSYRMYTCCNITYANPCFSSGKELTGHKRAKHKGTSNPAIKMLGIGVKPWQTCVSEAFIDPCWCSFFQGSKVYRVPAWIRWSCPDLGRVSLICLAMINTRICIKSESRIIGTRQ